MTDRKKTTLRLSSSSQDPWSDPETVARFAVSSGNEVLLRFAADERSRSTGGRLLDIGCGAGSNAVPLAHSGWHVLGLDRSSAMLQAARERAAKAGLARITCFEQAQMDALPIKDEHVDFVVAHGIWNLAGSTDEFRRGAAEAARVAKPGAPLFVYTFSRSSLPPDTPPVRGEPFVFTSSSGHPRCYLTEKQLIEELGNAGFDQETPITEYERIPGGKPAILEGIFRRSR